MHVDCRAQSVAVRAPPAEPDGQPVRMPFGDISEQLRRAIDDGNNSIDAAVVIEIAEGHSTIHRGLLKLRPGRGRNILEPLAFEITEHPIGQRRIAAKVSIELRKMREREEKVLPSVVIEDVHAEPPAGEPARAHQQTRALAVIFETAAAREITEQK